VSEDEASARVQRLSKLVGLESKLDNRISTLVSGQLKLVSIAIGLVADPVVLLLDEPTTGLDSTAAQNVIEYIKGIANLGVTVVLTIHQPSQQVFAMMDDLILLETKGGFAFGGAVSDAETYFAMQGHPTGDQENPADVFLAALATPPTAKGAAETWAGVFAAEQAGLQKLQPSAGVGPSGSKVFHQPPSESSRLWMLCSKLAVHYWRVPGMFTYRSFGIILFGFFLGSLYFDTPNETNYLTEINGSIFNIVWVSMYLSMSSVPQQIDDMRDAQAGYAAGRHKIWTWCLAQFLVSIPYSLLGSFIFMLPMHWFPGLNDSFETFVYAVLLSTLLQMTMESITWQVAELVRNAMLTVIAGLMVLGQMMIFAGFFVSVEDMPRVLFWMAYLMPSKYALSGLYYNYLHGEDYAQPDGSIVTGDQLLDANFHITYGDDTWRKWADLAIVLAFLLAFRFQHYQLMVMSTGKLGVTLSEDTMDDLPAGAHTIELGLASTIQESTTSMRERQDTVFDRPGSAESGNGPRGSSPVSPKQRVTVMNNVAI